MPHKLVLLIEDDADIRQSLIDILEIEGISVLSAGNGKEGIDLLLNASDLPSLILLDIMMPVMDGWEFLRERRRHLRVAQIPVVVMSAIKNQDPLEPVASFLPKPVDLNNLLTIVSKYVC